MNNKLFLTLAFAAGLFAISHMSDLSTVATVADNDVEEEMVMSNNDGDMDEMVVSQNDDEDLVMSNNDGDDLTLACGDDFFGDEEVQAQLECDDEACLNIAMTDDDVNLEDFVA